MLFSFIFSYLEDFFGVFYLPFFFILTHSTALRHRCTHHWRREARHDTAHGMPGNPRAEPRRLVGGHKHEQRTIEQAQHPGAPMGNMGVR